MQKAKEILPISNSLLVFSVAARLENFTHAGLELGMTQASVSYFIKQLEGNLEVNLFHREHRKVTLSEEGERLYQEISTGYSFTYKCCCL